jgi:MFS family permease
MSILSAPELGPPGRRPRPALPSTRGVGIVTGLFLMLMVSAGLGFYSLTVFLTALTTEQGFTVGQVSGATAVFFLISGLVGPGINHLLDRVDARLVMAGGAVAAAVALWLLGGVDRLWQLHATYALYGVGFAATSLVPATTVIARRFGQRRALALSFASTGLSVGGIVLTPFVAMLVEAHGLAGATPLIAAGFIIGVIPTTWLLIRPDPHDATAHAEGGPERLRAATLRNRFFVALTLGYILLMIAQVGALSHHFNLVGERTTSGLAALAVSVLAAASVVGRLFGGWLAVVWSTRALTLALVLVQLVALLVLATTAAPATLLVGSVLLGLSTGNLLMFGPLLLIEAFGPDQGAKAYAVKHLFTTIGTAGGPVLIGVIHDVAGGYAIAYGIAALCSALAVAVVVAAGHPRDAIPAEPSRTPA